MKIQISLSTVNELNFAQYIMHKLPKKFSDLSEVEDLFDSSYLEDASVHSTAMWLAGEIDNSKKKIDANAQERMAAKEAAKRAHWCVSNMEDKAQRPAMNKLADAWAKNSAIAIVRAAPNYRD